ncbi:outer membrane beta-barrel protein [Fibrobacter succinogenes]|uniref:outer membrane beta-barrel protein n=1 Tax=Fibrobacter succinogenes TaxID=833 RepID=UPI0013D13739|nr:outer membrane beta-barrel protein [Fibrobacter succinogenes]
MKKLFMLTALAASLSFATSEPHAHDGGFLSIAMGMGYQSIDFVVEEWQEETDNKAGLATDIDVKLGGNVSYNTLLHLTLAGTTKTGTTDYDREYEDIRVNMSLLGLGVTHYFENNIFITGSCGISQFHANSDVAVFSAVVKNRATKDINTGFGFQVGGGKEWWVSDNWGIGASAALLYGFASNLKDTKESSLGITLRFSATYN